METKVNDGVPQFENPNHENGFRGSHAGKLSTGCDWTNNDRITGGAPKESCSPGDYSFADRNISGFSALPSGSFGENSSAQWVFMNAGPVANNASGNALFTDAVFWSTQYSPSPSSTCCAWTRSLRCNSQGVFYTNYDKSHGYSVRCVRDAESGGEPTSATLQISLDEDSPSVCSGGSVTVTYTASVSDGASVDAYDYSWTVPTSVQYSANGNVCTVIYTEANTYTVSCTATPVGAGDAIGNEATVTVALGSGTLPAFTTCERDDNRHVKITSSENVQSFSWGDGTSSADISHDYSEDGVYTITAVNDNCSTSKTVSVGKKTLHPCAVTAIHNYTGDGEETVDSEGRVTTVKDYDGNIYSVAQIGSQCWLAENMRCTHSPSTGNPIVIQDDNIGEWDNMAATSCVSKAAHWYYNKEGHRFGILYNWCAAVDTFKSGEAEVATFERYTGDWYDGPDQIAWNANIGRNDVRRGICPKGWHVPNLQEVLNLATVVNNGNLTHEYPIYTGGNAGTLAKGCDWDNGSEDDESPETASPGDYEFAGRNQYGFGALPVGSFEYYEYYEDDDETGYSLFSGSAYRAAFWITTDNDSSHPAYAGSPWSLRLPIYNSVDIDIAPDRTKDAGMSVRCVRD